MKKIIAAICGTLVGGLVISSASAADLPRGPMITKAPVMAPMFSWTGFYVGANAGYGWGDTTGPLAEPVPGNFGVDGGFVGGQVGANWQFSNIVLGLEADIQWSGIDGNASVPGLNATADLDWFGTVRGRAGWAFDRSLLYVTGGYAYGRAELGATGPLSINASASKTLSGWTIGGGWEYAFAPNWSAKIEYLHIDFDKETFFSGCITSCRAGADLDLVRVGLNYRFGGVWR